MIRFRPAEASDAFAIIGLYQRDSQRNDGDTLFLDYRKLQRAIGNQESVWYLAENGGILLAMISGIVDREQRLCKLSRFLIDETSPLPVPVEDLLKYSLEELRGFADGIDVVYTTTFSMSMKHQELTLRNGFKILGIFPNALGKDDSQLNGLTAYYYPGVLKKKRSTPHALHAKVKVFHQISSRECGLTPLIFNQGGESLNEKWDHAILGDFDPLPELELIAAPHFVKHQFNLLKERRSEIADFYPFHEPNALITDASQKIQVFARINSSNRFAAIIGEHLRCRIHPAELYRRCLTLMQAQHVNYIEIINDAADTLGTAAMIEAGFTPTAYFPAFKRQGDIRRDYVVLGKSFGYTCRPNLRCHRTYVEFFRQYYKLERRNYLKTSIDAPSGHAN